MDILNSFYAFLGGGNVMKGSRYFNIFLAALVCIIIVIIIACIAISIINDRKRKNVSLKSAKSEKIREKRARGVFNYDSEGRFIGGDEDEPEDSQDGDQRQPRPSAGKRRKADNKAVIDMIRRSHADHDEDDDRSTPQVSLKPVSMPHAPADNASAPTTTGMDTATSLDMDADPDMVDYNASPEPAAGTNTADPYDPAGGRARMPVAEPAIQDPTQGETFPGMQAPQHVSMPMSMPAAPAPIRHESHADDNRTGSIQQQTSQQPQQPSNGGGRPRHARHARNPFSQPVSAEDIEGGQQ